MENRISKGDIPSRKAPITLRDFIGLLNHLINPPFLEGLYLIQSLYQTKSCARTCRLFSVQRSVLATLLRAFRREYSFLTKHTEDGETPFTTKEMIALVAVICAKVVTNRLLCNIILAYVIANGHYKEVCNACHIPYSTYYYYLSQYIAGPFMNFCIARIRKSNKKR